MDPSLRNDILNIPLFSGVDMDPLLAVLSSCSVEKFATGQYICRYGDYEEKCSIILSGSAEVRLPQEGAKRGKSFPLNQGEIFGEIAVLSGNPRTADIVASGPAKVLNLSRRTLFKLLDRFPLIKQRLDDLYRERALNNFLLTIPLFSEIPESFLEELVKRVGLESSHKGTVIFRQGDEADSFYLVRYGLVKISECAESGQERVLAYLKEGHYFGEMALLKEGIRRMATVTALNRLELIRIRRQDFQDLLNAHPSVRANLEYVVAKREERNIQIRQDNILERSLSTVLDIGVIEAMTILINDLTKCVQCDNCVKACGILHDGHTRLQRKGVMLSHSILVSTSCRHCDDPLCMTECPTGAIARDVNGEVYIKDNCIGNGSCARNCPYDNIFLVPRAPEKGKKRRATHKAVKCDMCRDYARNFFGCVYNCPTGAAQRINPADFFTDLASVG